MQTRVDERKILRTTLKAGVLRMSAGTQPNQVQGRVE
jgi:hypothetical protein